MRLQKSEIYKVIAMLVFSIPFCICLYLVVTGSLPVKQMAILVVGALAIITVMMSLAVEFIESRIEYHTKELLEQHRCKGCSCIKIDKDGPCIVCSIRNNSPMRNHHRRTDRTEIS